MPKMGDVHACRIYEYPWCSIPKLRLRCFKGIINLALCDLTQATLPIDLHKRCLMLYAIMIFITEVWSGLCKLTSNEFWPNSTRPYFFNLDAGAL